MDYNPHSLSLSLCVLLVVLVSGVRSGDFESLLSLRSSIDPSNSLQWPGSDVCSWEGIKECMNGRVTKLVLEHLNLSGTLDEKSLNRLDQIRVLSFKGNSINGQIPDLSGLHNLKSLFLNDNNFSGDFPASVTLLHRLKTIVLSGNLISGDIPFSLLNLRRLYVLYLENNLFSGQIPPFNQSSLRFFNVSNNNLSGEIPITPALIRFNISSFSSNNNLCGEQIHIPCNNSSNGLLAPAPSTSPAPPLSNHHRRRKKIIAIIAASVSGLFIVLLVLCSVFFCLFSRKRRENRGENRGGKIAVVGDGGGGDEL